MNTNDAPLRSTDVTDLEPLETAVAAMAAPAVAAAASASTAPAPGAPPMAPLPATPEQAQAEAEMKAIQEQAAMRQAQNKPKVWVSYVYEVKKGKQRFATIVIDGMFDLRTHSEIRSLANAIFQERKQEGVEILFWKPLEG